MSKITTQPGQTSINAHQQGAGTIEGLFQTLRTNGLTLEDPTPGEEISVTTPSPSRSAQAAKEKAVFSSAPSEGEIRLWRALKSLKVEGAATLISWSCLRTFMDI